MPAFNGDLSEYIRTHLQYPPEQREKSVEGTTSVQFIVSEEGRIGDAVIVRSSGDAALDAEALRLVRAMPRWKPGRQQGMQVPVLFVLPVTFKLK